MAVLLVGVLRLAESQETYPTDTRTWISVDPLPEWPTDTEPWFSPPPGGPRSSIGQTLLIAGIVVAFVIIVGVIVLIARFFRRRASRLDKKHDDLAGSDPYSMVP
jgi:hypothetical protein